MKTINILLIEDNSQDIRLIKEMLKEIRSFNYYMVSAATLKEGCKQIQENNFDIILLDLNLPDSTGQQTFQKVIDCCKEIPVILITGVEDEELSLKLIMEGAQDYITKQSLNSSPLGKVIQYSIERQALLRNIKIKNVQIDRIEKERILLAQFPSQNPGPVLRIAINGKLLYINEAGAKLLPDWQLIINEIIPAWLKDIIDPIFTNGINIEFERSHHEFIFSFFAVLFIEDGYVNLYGREVTAHKLASRSLIASETRYRRLFETAKDGILILDAETGNIVDVNPFLVELLGYSKEQIIEKAIWEIGSFKDIVDNYDKFSELQLKGFVRYENLPLETAYGRKINVEFVSNVYFVDHLKVIQCNIRDITERKLVEDSLHESEERFRAVFEQAGVGVAILNTKTGEFVRVNQKYCDFVGYSIEEMLQKTFMDITFHDDIQNNIDRNAQLIEGTIKEFSFEKRYVHKNGNILWGTLTVSSLWKPDEKPQTYFHIAIVENITKRKQAEEALKEKSAELERSNRLMTGREIKMIELKIEINQLLVKSGEKEKYNIAEQVISISEN